MSASQLNKYPSRESIRRKQDEAEWALQDHGDIANNSRNVDTRFDVQYQELDEKIETYLNPETTTIDVIPKKQVIVLLKRAANLEYLHKIILQGVTRYSGEDR